MKGLGGLTNPLLNKPNTGAPSSYTSEAPSSPLTNFPLGPNPAHFDFSKRFVPIVSVLTGIAPPGTFASTQFADFEFFNSAQTEVSGDVTYCYCVRVMGTAIIQEASPIYQAILQQAFLDVSKSATTFYLGLRSSLHARYKAARQETMTKDWYVLSRQSWKVGPCFCLLVAWWSVSTWAQWRGAIPWLLRAGWSRLRNILLRLHLWMLRLHLLSVPHEE